MNNNVDNLATEKATLIAEYLRIDNATPNVERERQRLAISLDNLYWRYVEQILQHGLDLNAATLNLSPTDKLLLNFGLLDSRLVKNAPADLAQKLLAENELVGTPNHFYLADWLIDRLKRYKLDSEVTGDATATKKTNPTSTVWHSGVYAEVKKFLEGNAEKNSGAKLSGVSATALSAFLEGRLDQQIALMSAKTLQQRQKNAFVNRHRLAKLRREIITRARVLVSDNTQLKLFDTLDETYIKEWRAANSNTAEVAPTLPTAPTELADVQAERAFHWLLSELRFVRTLLPLGALAGGIFRPCAVMLEYRERVTRAHTAQMLARVQWCDRSYQVAPVVLIAPFTGRGIYEWDRDSLVISLFPVASPEGATANAMANYTMMIDSFQNKAHLKNTYCAMFPQTNFQKDFQADYRLWLSRVGAGDIAALPADKLTFFLSLVAPDFITAPALALAPAELRTLSQGARGLIRKQIQKQVAQAKDSWMARWRLGILFWLDNYVDEALRELTNAAKLAPQELQTYFAVALLLHSSGKSERAQQLLTICQQRGAKTIWKLYAEKTLARITT